MPFFRYFLAILVVGANQAAAQTVRGSSGTTVDSARVENESVDHPLQFGIATGALRYAGGRTEQALSGVVRWAPRDYFAMSANPTVVHQRAPILNSTRSTSKGGIVDLPVDATLSHSFDVAYSPWLSATLGATLPVGDTASGFGTGTVGYSVSTSMSVSPTDQLSLSLGFGHSLTAFSAQTAFTGGSGWGNIGANYSISDRVSVSGGYSSDVGTVDPTLGRSSSLSGGFALDLGQSRSLNLSMTHGLSGVSPEWSFAMGFGTAFPSVGRVGSGLQNTFGGGSHGLSSGSGKTTTSGRGKSGG